jgi:hypothetical protein
MLPRWSSDAMDALLGLDRDEDFGTAEREESDCIAVVTAGDPQPWPDADPAVLVEAARRAAWHGVANPLSPSRVEWPIIDEVARSTRYPGVISGPQSPIAHPKSRVPDRESRIPDPESRFSDPAPARQIILQRRSAVAFDGRSALPRATFLAMLARLQPPAPPWDAIDWPPHIHLLIFVHRVDGLTPGLYAYLRDPAVLDQWRAAMRPAFLWERIHTANDPNDRNVPNDRNLPNGPNVPNAPNDLYLLVPTDVTWAANRLSCDQDIAADGFFSLGMIARLESSLLERGEWFYRRLFWESGLLGQVLYLEAEAVGARATGIGCFYDDPVHEMAGLSGHEWQSLYHFSMGAPVEDARLTSEPGYPWDARGGA